MLLFLLPTVAQSISILESSSGNTFPDTSFYLYPYIIIPIIYCIVVSLLFHPKRLVSPLHIQIGSVFLYLSFIIYNTFTTTGVTLQSLDDLIIALLVMLLIAIVTGYFQFFIVRWVIGLNFNSMERTSFTVNEKLNTVMKILDGNFIKSWKLSREKDIVVSKRIWILKHRDGESNIIITTGEHQEKKTIIAITAFKKNEIGILKSEECLLKLDVLINDIKGKLKDANSKLTLTKNKDTNDFISQRAYGISIGASRSKIGIAKVFFSGIPKKFKIGIFVTILALFLLPIFHHLEYIDLNNYISLVVIIIITIIFQICFSRKEEIFKKKVEDLDE